MRRSPSLSSPLAEASFEESLQVATSPCCRRDLPDVISANPSRSAWAPVTAVPWTAPACFFPPLIRLPPHTIQVRFPPLPTQTISLRIPLFRPPPFPFFQPL